MSAASPPRLTPELSERLGARLGRPGPDLEAFVVGVDDIEQLARLSFAAFGDDALSAAKLRFYVERAHALALGLRREAVIVSYTLAELNRGQRRVYIVETCTRDGEQGHGHASWLRARLAAITFALGYRTQTTHVRQSNRAAQQLNHRAGMQLVRAIPRYYDDGETGLYLARLLTADDDGRREG